MLKNQTIVNVLFLHLSLPKTCMLINAFKIVRDIIILTPHNVFIRIGYIFIAQTKCRKILSLRPGPSMPIQAILAIKIDVFLLLLLLGVFVLLFFFFVCFFLGGVFFFVIHYLIKTLFIMKIKTVIKTTHLVIKNYSPYQIRPDTVDLLFHLLLNNFNSLNLNIYMYCHFKTKTEH